MEDFEAALGKATPTPGFIPEGLSFERIIKNETAIVSLDASTSTTVRMMLTHC